MWPSPCPFSECDIRRVSNHVTLGNVTVKGSFAMSVLIDVEQTHKQSGLEPRSVDPKTRCHVRAVRAVSDLRPPALLAARVTGLTDVALSQG